MIDKNLYRLEFSKILEIIANHCITKSGKELALNLTPSNNIETVQKSLDETSMALNLLVKKGSIPIEEIADIDIYIKTLESGNSLSSKALLELANILKISKHLKEYFDSEANMYLLQNIFNTLYTNENIESKIFSSILDENTIDDNASPALSSLRRNRKKLEQDVRDKLFNFIHSSNYSKYIMDSIITIRNDRFVIPVKEEYRSKISGSILDISASGSTVYIEPSSVYELNNKINNIKALETSEIEKILSTLSLMLMPITENLDIDAKTIGLLDFIFAKAKYAKKINGISPILNNNKYINLINAKHPLIDEKIVIPINISIGEKYNTLLITGPNTGGKTATLKTTGLLVAMACSGIFIPASENSSIYVFDKIFADIGDEQSIQESLSTFSSHILNVIDILNTSTANSLILLDELGSGTDPVEGASLAISILKHFHNQNSLTIASTHYPELKNYALVTNGFENASCDFDVTNLKPTYKLLIGVPGKSNAFAISKNLGLPAEILEEASNRLEQDDVNIESLLKSDDKLKIEKEKQNIIKNSNQIELLRKSLERDNTKLNEEAENIITNAKQKARDILLDAKEEANEIIKELNDEKIDLKTANLLRTKLNSAIYKTSTDELESKNKIQAGTITRENIKIGQNVFIKRLNQTAKVLSLPNKSNEVQVQMGIMNMTVKLEELFPVSHSNTNNNAAQTTTSFKSNLKTKTINSEINVIGLNVDEAIPIIDKYLDDSSVSGLSTVRIVHGKGTGKLRKGIHTFLKSHPHVKTFRLGTFGEGEMGVTVVELKS